MLIVKVTSTFLLYNFLLEIFMLLYEYVWSSFLIEKYNHVEIIHGGFMVGVLLTSKMDVSVSNFLGKLLDEK